MKLTMRHHALAFAALLALTLLTFGLSFVPLGGWGTPTAMGLAAAKALIVAGFFMHLVEESTSHRLVFAVAVGMFLLLVFFTTLDVHTRDPASAVSPGARPPAVRGSAP